MFEAGQTIERNACKLAGETTPLILFPWAVYGGLPPISPTLLATRLLACPAAHIAGFRHGDSS